jgi:hypothetical protein
MPNLAARYDALLLLGSSSLPKNEEEELWHEWLWECDCNAPPMERCFDLNEMHVVGLLLCLHQSKQDLSDCLNNTLTPEVVRLFPDRPLRTLSIRETLDQLECLQLHWGPVLTERRSDDEPMVVVRALMARLGELAHHAYPLLLTNNNAELDDPQHITQLPATTTNEYYGIVSRKTLRQALCTLFALCRVHAIVTRATHPDPAATARFGNAIVRSLRMHHVESSQDLFDTLQQMVYLAPGQRLAYRTLFAGMYNSVSQVVYFHHPRFSRQPQYAELSRIPSSPLHMLPLVTQLLPQIEICYDDDSHVPVFMMSNHNKNQTKKWAWLVACGGFFLLDVERGLVLAPPPWAAHQPLVALVAHYLWHNPEIDLLCGGESTTTNEEEEAPEKRKEDASASHVCFVTSERSALI